jgi:DNA-binding NtrC family response regulator
MSRNLEIVIVDDEPSITDLIESYIRFASKTANVHSFTDSAKAQHYIKQNDVDVLITDYNMPDVNGLQLMESTKPDTRRIMISGYVSDLAEEKLRNMNAVVFEKPIPMKKIGKIIADEEVTHLDSLL